MRTPAAYLLVGLLLSAAVGAQERPAPEPAALLAALAAREARAPAGRLEVVVSDRRGPLRAGETPHETSRRLAAEAAVAAEGTVTYGPAGWLRDLRLPPSRFSPHPSRTRTAEMGGVLRTLVEDRAEGVDRRQARVIRIPATAPGDAVLTHRAGETAGPVTWTVQSRDEGQVTLDGRRGGERHTLILRTGGVGEGTVRSWRLVRQRVVPTGETYEQTYHCETALDGSGGLERLDEWVSNGAPLGTVSHRITQVRKRELLAAVKPDQIALRFPVGTQVVDARGEVPVEYEQTEEGLSEEEILATATEFGQDRLKVGQTVPDFTFREVRKSRERRLSDFKGRPVLLLWFSSGSRISQAAADGFRDLYSEYRRRGLEILALAVGDDEERAEAFRKKHRWEFPVTLDPEGEGVRRFGTVPAVPKVALIDRDAKLIYVQPGINPQGIVAALDLVVKPDR